MVAREDKILEGVGLHAREKVCSQLPLSICYLMCRNIICIYREYSTFVSKFYLKQSIERIKFASFRILLFLVHVRFE